MSSTLSNKQVAGICAAIVVGFGALHAWLTPPWVVWSQFGDTAAVALGTWAVAPCAMAALALLVGDADLSARRNSPFDDTQSIMAAALLPLLVLAAMAAMREPLAYAPQGWMAQLALPALAVGAGLALCALFWQGVVQQRMPEHWPGVMRVIAAAGLASVIWLPFVLNDATGDGDFPIWIDLFLLSATAAILQELGMTTRVIMGLVAFAGAGATFVHAPLFL